MSVERPQPAGAAKPGRGGRRPVSGVLIVLNEAERLGACLDSLTWCDEIVVVDSGSTDRTADLARERGCRVVSRPFDGYGEQKRFAASLASHDMIFSIDADEVVTAALARDIEAALAAPGDDVCGYLVPRTLVFLGREFRYGAEHADPLLRLFDRRRGGFTSARVHEKIVVDGPTRTLRGELLHYSYRDLHQYFQKFNAYTTAASLQLKETGGARSPLLAAALIPLYFLKHYLLRGNALNGYEGFVWSFLSSLYPVVKHMKGRERPRAEVTPV